MTQAERVRKLQILLISVKVSIEYGMGFTKNQYLIFALKDLEKATELAYTLEEFEEDEHEIF